MSLDPNKKYIFAGTKGTTKEWEEDDRVLPECTFGYDTERRYLKIGDGVTKFSDLRPVEGDGLPLGAIIIWTRPLDEIPHAWAICDGRTVNGIKTPDLRDRFVKSVPTATTNPGATGGSHTITLTEDHLPAHDHAFSGWSHKHNCYVHNHGVTSTIRTVESGNHKHPTSTRIYDPGGGGFGGLYWSINRRGTATYRAGIHTTLAGSHTHSKVDDSTPTAVPTGEQTSGSNTTLSVSVGYTGYSSAINNQPPFYLVCFIMKVIG